LQAVPNEPGTFIALESTANGQNYFKDLWDAASAGSGLHPVLQPWFEEPTYRRAFANEGSARTSRLLSVRDRSVRTSRTSSRARV
jgi:hypothetical protein